MQIVPAGRDLHVMRAAQGTRAAISRQVAIQTSPCACTNVMNSSSSASRLGRPMICGCIVSTKEPPSSRMPRNSDSQISRTSLGVEIAPVPG